MATGGQVRGVRVEGESREKVAGLKAQLANVILGKDEVIQNLFIALLSGNHILMEDVPGVEKTTLAKRWQNPSPLNSSACNSRPIFCPPISWVPQSTIRATAALTFKPGPIFTNILLADEINRASPRTQSSLLEAMSERQASIEGTTHLLPAPFLVVATQNPIEFHGTYPQPEAQLDRRGGKVSSVSLGS